MPEVEISVQLLGVLASFVAAGFSAIPALGETSSRRAIVAIIVLILGVFIEQGMAFTTIAEFGETLLSAAVYAVGTYSLFLKPIVKPGVEAASSAYAARFNG